MPRLEAGTTLVSRYEIKELDTSPHLDVELWHAEDKIFGRQVDIYVLDEKVPAGALDRARKSAQLNVERIARVIDVIDKGVEQRFIVTERPDGVTTAAAIAFAPFNLKQTKAVIGSIATSLVKAGETQFLRHGALTSDSIHFKNDSVLLTGLVPRNFLGLNQGVPDEELAAKDTKGLAALTYFMLTGLMANYSGDDSQPLPKLFGFVEDAEKNLDTYTTDILNGNSSTISTPQAFLDALGEWSESDLPYVHKPEKPLRGKPESSSKPAKAPQRTSAKSATTSAIPLPSSQPPAAIGGAAATLAAQGLGKAAGTSSAAQVAGAAGVAGTAALAFPDEAIAPGATSTDATTARAAGGPPRFLPSTNDKVLGAPTSPAPASSQASPSSPHWASPAVPETSKRGLSATPFVIVLMVAGLVASSIWAINAISAPTVPAIVSPTGRPTGSTSSEPTQAPTTEIVLPVAKGAVALDPHGDNNEHPELQDLLVDGDATTAWYSRTYKTPDFGGINKSGIGVAVTLEQKALVSSVLVSSTNKGGNVEIRATSGDNPEEGTVLASGPLDGETIFKLDTPTETESIVVWFTEMPTDEQGAHRIYLYEISLT